MKTQLLLTTLIMAMYSITHLEKKNACSPSLNSARVSAAQEKMASGTYIYLWVNGKQDAQSNYNTYYTRVIKVCDGNLGDDDCVDKISTLKKRFKNKILADYDDELMSSGTPTATHKQEEELEDFEAQWTAEIKQKKTKGHQVKIIVL